MTETQAADYLAAKGDALRFRDAEGGREEAMKQFLDEKVFRPGLGKLYPRGPGKAAEPEIDLQPECCRGK